jgi:peptide/nickel transport system substrate-binding protein
MERELTIKLFLMRRLRSLRSRIHFRPPSWAVNFYTATTIAERVSIVVLLLLLIVSGSMSITNLIMQKTLLVPQSGGIYTEATVGQPRYLNPIVSSASDLDMDITKLVYSGLFRFNSDLELTNDLAISRELSEDEKIYTIALRDDVFWHDGERFDADDVLFTFRSIQTPDYTSPLATSFQGVEVSKVDDFTVTFKLKQPYAPFLTSLTVGIVPEHVWSQIAPQNATLTEQILKPVGTGPFKFHEITTRRKTGDITSYSLVKNTNYYQEPPYLDQITFTFYTTHSEALQAMQSGKADGIGFLPLEDIKTITQNRSTKINQLLLPQYFAIFFNTQKNKALGEAGVRAALSIATDRQQIVEQALSSQGQPLHLPIPPSILSFDGDTDSPLPNVEAAQQNLSESGWELGEGGFRYKDDEKLSIKLTTTDWPEYIKTAELLKEQWSQLGVEVTLEHLGAGTVQQIAVQPRDYEALLFGEILPPDPDPYAFWHSTQTRSPGLNLAMFKNKDVDKILEDARKTSDKNKRVELYRDFQNKILELTPAIILYQPYYLFVTHGVYGADSNQAALPSGRFNNIEQWHINTKRVWK